MLSLPIALRLLLAAQPELVTPVLQVVQRVLSRHLLDRAGLEADEGHGGAVTLIQRFGSAANLIIHLPCLVLDGVNRCGGDGVPIFVEVDAPTDEEVEPCRLGRRSSSTSVQSSCRTWCWRSAPLRTSVRRCWSAAPRRATSCWPSKSRSWRTGPISTPRAWAR